LTSPVCGVESFSEGRYPMRRREDFVG